MDIEAILKDFESKQQTINISIELSNEGKARAMQRLKTEIDQARPLIIRDLQNQWQALKTQAARNIAQVQQAEEEAAKQWDYARLEYMARTIKNTIANAASLGDVIEQYNQVKQSGDLHARRAWAENASEAVKAKYHDGDSIVFLTQLANDARDLTETPSIKEAKAKGSDLTKQARILNAQTDLAQKFLTPDNVGIFSMPDEFTAMRQGVHISEQYAPEIMGTVTTVTID